MCVAAVLQLVNNSSMPDLDQTSAAVWMNAPVYSCFKDPSAPDDHELEALACRKTWEAAVCSVIRPARTTHGTIRTGNSAMMGLCSMNFTCKIDANICVT